jgi:hypothetical protein
VANCKLGNEYWEGRTGGYHLTVTWLDRRQYSPPELVVAAAALLRRSSAAAASTTFADPNSVANYDCMLAVLPTGLKNWIVLLLDPWLLLLGPRMWVVVAAVEFLVVAAVVAVIALWNLRLTTFDVPVAVAAYG